MKEAESDVYIFQLAEGREKTLLLGAGMKRCWGFAEVPYDARSLARCAELLLRAALQLRRGFRRSGRAK